MNEIKSYMVITHTGQWSVGGDHLVALQNLFHQTGILPERYCLFEITGDNAPILSDRNTILTKTGAVVTDHGIHVRTKEGFRKLP